MLKLNQPGPLYALKAEQYAQPAAGAATLDTHNTEGQNFTQTRSCGLASKGKQGLGRKLSQTKPAAKPGSMKLRGEDKRVWNARFGFNSRWHDSYTKSAVEGVKRIRGPEFNSATAQGRIRRRPFDCVNGEAAD